jgi:hypothetical protein
MFVLDIYGFFRPFLIVIWQRVFTVETTEQEVVMLFVQTGFT